jgi:hypothetical protein
MPDELKCEDRKAKRKAFDVKVNEALADTFRVEDFKDDPDLSDIKTPTYESYKDDDDGAYITVLDIDDADPNTHDCYVGTEVNLLIKEKSCQEKSDYVKGKPMTLSRGLCIPIQSLILARMRLTFLMDK